MRLISLLALWFVCGCAYWNEMYAKARAKGEPCVSLCEEYISPMATAWNYSKADDGKSGVCVCETLETVFVEGHSKDVVVTHWIKWHQ